MTTANFEKDWSSLFVSLNSVLAPLGVANPYGEGDYWLVDDYYGDTAHKICVHNPMLLNSGLIASIQNVLTSYPNWRVLIQMEFQMNGETVPPEGIVIFANRVEQHWDESQFAALVQAMGLG
jgi:hypothetical protein